MGSCIPDAAAMKDGDGGEDAQEASTSDSADKSPAQLLDLSDDVLFYILKMLPPRDLKALGFTCPRLGALVCDHMLWQRVDDRNIRTGQQRLKWLLTHCLTNTTTELKITGYADCNGRCQGVHDPAIPRHNPRVANNIPSPENAENMNAMDNALMRMWFPHLPRYSSSPRWLSQAEREQPLKLKAEGKGEASPSKPPLNGGGDASSSRGALEEGPSESQGPSGDKGKAGDDMNVDQAEQKVKSEEISCPGPQFSLTAKLLRDLNRTCPKLTSLFLEYCNIDYRTTNISQFPRALIKLSLRGTRCFNQPLNKSYLCQIMDYLPELEYFDVSECDWFEPSSLMPLSKLTKLREFYMKKCLRLTECVAYASLATRYGFRELRILDARGSPLADSEVAALGWLPNLEELYVSPPDDEEEPPPHTHKWRETLPPFQELEQWELEEPDYYKLTDEPSEEEDIEPEQTRPEEETNGNHAEENWHNKVIVVQPSLGTGIIMAPSMPHNFARRRCANSVIDYAQVKRARRDDDEAGPSDDGPTNDGPTNDGPSNNDPSINPGPNNDAGPSNRNENPNNDTNNDQNESRNVQNVPFLLRRNQDEANPNKPVDYAQLRPNNEPRLDERKNDYCPAHQPGYHLPHCAQHRCPTPFFNYPHTYFRFTGPCPNHGCPTYLARAAMHRQVSIHQYPVLIGERNFIRMYPFNFIGPPNIGRVPTHPLQPPNESDREEFEIVPNWPMLFQLGMIRPVRLEPIDVGVQVDVDDLNQIQDLRANNVVSNEIGQNNAGIADNNPLDAEQESMNVETPNISDDTPKNDDKDKAGTSNTAGCPKIIATQADTDETGNVPNELDTAVNKTNETSEDDISKDENKDIDMEEAGSSTSNGNSQDIKKVSDVSMKDAPKTENKELQNESSVNQAWPDNNENVVRDEDAAVENEEEDIPRNNEIRIQDDPNANPVVDLRPVQRIGVRDVIQHQLEAIGADRPDQGHDAVDPAYPQIVHLRNLAHFHAHPRRNYDIRNHFPGFNPEGEINSRVYRNHGHQLVTDNAVLRFGRGNNEHVVHIGHEGIILRNGASHRPDRSNLRVLSITGFVTITDRSLVHLATAAPELRRLDFTRTSVTDRGVDTFRAERPDCEVIYSKFSQPPP